MLTAPSLLSPKLPTLHPLAAALPICLNRCPTRDSLLHLLFDSPLLFLLSFSASQATNPSIQPTNP